MTPHKTDNSRASAKVDLRVRAVRSLKQSHVSVLDAYHGTGRMWRTVRELCPDLTIDVLGIDTRDMGPGVLKGDNRKFLGGLNLQEFDLIDLDAYGCPTDQLRIVSERAPGIPVVATCIRQGNTPIPHKMLDAARIPFFRDGKTAHLLNGIWPEVWENYVHSLGFRSWEMLTFRDGGMVKFYGSLWYT